MSGFGTKRKSAAVQKSVCYWTWSDPQRIAAPTRLTNLLALMCHPEFAASVPGKFRRQCWFAIAEGVRRVEH
jgi:hypothetical protein